MPLNDLLRQRTHAVATSLNSHRILLYTLVSLVTVSAAIANALKNHSNFYSVAIYLSKSSRSVLILANFGFLLALLCGHVVQKIFFGALRPNEVERLYDRLWFFITESLLAFTIFRDEFDIPFALMFGFLLFVKSFHWLAGDRIEWMDQRPYPGPSPLFHVRMSTLFVILWMTDFLMFLIAVENTLTNGVGGMVLFASEYGILMASVLNATSKYLLSAYELRRAGQRGGENAPPWENKSMWVFYIELATDFLKLTTYLVFFTIIITFYGLPLNIVRDVYITARSFIARLQALHRYQTATRNMDQRYPNATEDEMTAMSDRTCIICREEMVVPEAVDPPQRPVPEGPNTTPKRLPCGHIFHFHCLRSWLERQQSCPTCRRTVLEDTPPAQVPVGPPQPLAAQPPFGAPDAQNHNQNPQGINNPLGNPLGLVGRLFGPPAQAPIAPGQFMQGQPPQNNPDGQQNAINLGGQQPGGLVIQYHIQYQLPRQQPVNQAQQAPRPLQPVPEFPGFAGPGGEWQQWPVDRRAPDEAQGLPASQAQESISEVPTVPVAEAPTQPDPSTPSSSSSRPIEGHVSTPPTPREAAALAALRRLNGTEPSVPRETPTTATPNANASGPSEPTAPSPVTNLATSNSVSNNQQLEIPKLIPLYDYGTYGANAGAPSNASNGATHASFTRPPQVPRLYPRVPLPPPRNLGPSNLQSSRLYLPPTLTNEQLATMDRVTREAIDERLRVLEGVSGSVNRCIDDLMRMRSVLPSSDPSTTAHTIPITPTSAPFPSGSSASAESTTSQTSDNDAAVANYRTPNGSNVLRNGAVAPNADEDQPGPSTLSATSAET